MRDRETAKENIRRADLALDRIDTELREMWTAAKNLNCMPDELERVTVPPGRLAWKRVQP